MDLGGAASRAAVAQPAGPCLDHGGRADAGYRSSRVLGRAAPARNVSPAGNNDHRGLTHSLAAMLACLVVLRWEGLSRAVSAPLIVGYLSRLGADPLTTSGPRLAWPFARRQAIGLCRTGSMAESVIVASMAIGTGFDMPRLHPAVAL